MNTDWIAYLAVAAAAFGLGWMCWKKKKGGGCCGKSSCPPSKSPGTQHSKS